MGPRAAPSLHDPPMHRAEIVENLKIHTAEGPLPPAVTHHDDTKRGRLATAPIPTDVAVAILCLALCLLRWRRRRLPLMRILLSILRGRLRLLMRICLGLCLLGPLGIRPCIAFLPWILTALRFSNLRSLSLSVLGSYEILNLSEVLLCMLRVVVFTRRSLPPGALVVMSAFTKKRIQRCLRFFICCRGCGWQVVRSIAVALRISIISAPRKIEVQASCGGRKDFIICYEGSLPGGAPPLQK